MTIATRSNVRQSNSNKSKKRAATSHTSRADRKALVKSLRGSLSWVDYSVQQYLEEKYAETERESHS